MIFFDTGLQIVELWKMKTTFEEFTEAKTPRQRKEYEEGYRDFLLFELILAAMEEDDVSVRKLAKLGVSPTTVQDMKSGTKISFNTKSLFKVLHIVIPLGLIQNTEKSRH